MSVLTSDFKTFETAQEYYNPGFPVIDATFLNAPELGNSNTWVRWVKDERDLTIFQEISQNGLLGSWKRVGNAPAKERITSEF